MKGIPAVRKTFEYHGYRVDITIDLSKTIRMGGKGDDTHEYFNACATMCNPHTRHSIPTINEPLYFNTLTDQAVKLEEKAKQLIDYNISTVSVSVEMSLIELGYSKF